MNPKPVTIAEFKKILEQFPDDAIVQVAEGFTRPYDGTRIVNFDTTKHLNFVDFTNNQFVKNDPSHPAYGLKILEIGSN